MSHRTEVEIDHALAATVEEYAGEDRAAAAEAAPGGAELALPASTARDTVHS
jgi:hypothetical protein